MCQSLCSFDLPKKFKDSLVDNTTLHELYRESDLAARGWTS